MLRFGEDGVSPACTRHGLWKLRIISRRLWRDTGPGARRTPARHRIGAWRATFGTSSLMGRKGCV
eukprot:11055425-Alexandrium_andersonii.AAC.1